MAHHRCLHPVFLTIAIVILVALICVLTVPKTAIALSSEHWVHFFPAWTDIISTILKKKKIQAELQNYRDHFHKTPTIGYEILNLVLGAFPEFRKSEMASSSVVLGLAPALLQQLSPTYADTAELAICRPVLAFMIAAGSPAVCPMDPSNCVNVVNKLEDKPKQEPSSDDRGYARIEEECKWTDDLAPTIICVSEYILAAVAIANNVHLAYALGVWAVCSFAPSNTTLASVCNAHQTPAPLASAMANYLSHGTAPGSLPTSASVLEFICLFTHDLKRKQKRWQDGTLKYHTFNKRIMVSDDRGHFIGDAHWQTGGDLEPGDEFELDRGSAIVQVSDCTGQREQDLTELLDKRAKEVEKRRANAISRTSRPSNGVVPSPAQDQSPHFQLRHRPLTSIVGTPSRIGRAVISPHSPYEVRQMAQRAQQPEQSERPAQPEDPPPSKRRKQDLSPLTKPSHARSLFGAALTLTPLPTSSLSAQIQVLRDRPNASLKTLLPTARETDQSQRQPGNSLQQPVEVESSPDLPTTHPCQSSEVAIKPSRDVSCSVTEPKKPRAIEVESLADLSMTGSRRLPEAKRKMPKDISCSMIETRKPMRRPLADNSNTDTLETYESPPSPPPIVVTSIQPKKRPVPKPPPRTDSVETGHREPAMTKDQQPSNFKLPKKKAPPKEKEIPTPTPDKHDQAPSENEPRTELRIRSRQRRGLLVMSEKHGQERNPAKRSRASVDTVESPAGPRSGHPQQGEAMLNAEEPTSADAYSGQAPMQNKPMGKVEAPTESATSVISAGIQVLEDDALNNSDGLLTRDSSPEVEPRTIRSRSTGKNMNVDGALDSKTNTRVLRDRRTRKLAIQLVTSDEEDEAEATASSLAPKASDQMHGSRATKSSSSGPRIAKMARKSVRSKEIIGFVVPDDEPTMAAFTFAAPLLVANRAVGDTVIGNIVGGEAESSHMNETLKPTAQPDAVAQPAATGSSDDKSKARPKARPTPRLSNPASRGKKAAKLEDAAGLLPQTVIQLDPVVPARVGAPKPRASSVKQSELPGFTKANGGAWSRHAEDLLVPDYDRGDGRIRPPWNDELQRLYDRWRDAVDCDGDFESSLDLDRDRALLQVPSWRRSPSQQSGRSSPSSCSPSAEPDDDDISEQGKRPQRRGPLTKTKREKTAFIRRLGACPSCRTRKVGCTHWDYTEFEQCYQASKLCGEISSERRDDLGYLSDGVELAGLEPHSPLALMPQFEMDFDPATLPRSSPASPMSPLAPLTPMFFPSQPCVDWAIPTTEDGYLGITPLMRNERLIAIGSEVSASDEGFNNWQCRFNLGEVWTPRALAAPCGERFSTPSEVVDHFFATHHLIELDASPIRYREQWIYGYAVQRCGWDGAVERSEASQGW
ncbi:hypothetical protein AK830_g236 [Neonectria ditissima]|uniref:5'-3' DNA helicase ZGRF1-like N-terminal domain-containing protein n=1 Tax=Neonectria ditissima TaxID=78410 RepID=A0A0P7BM38_9HYPO|nr:hypothetical protein AK830_g236 [Neonectria ditissima]